MSIRVLNADCLTALPQLAAEGFRAHAVLRPLHSLQLSLYTAVARLAERDQVGEFVRLPVVAKQAIRLDVMNISPRRQTPLACAGVPLARRSLLRRPVRTTVTVWSVNELRMFLAYAVRVSARSGAVLPTAICAHQPGWGHLKGSGTADTDNGRPGVRRGFARGVMACRGAMLSSSMAPPAQIASKYGPTERAIKVSLRRRAFRSGALTTDVSKVSTFARAVTGRYYPVWSNSEANSALLTADFNHWLEA